MRITYHDEKRALTLERRGLDFEDALIVLTGDAFTVEDDRQNYGEVRFQTIGRLGDRLVMIVWTPRGDAHHVISMRKCNDRERQRYDERLG